MCTLFPDSFSLNLLSLLSCRPPFRCCFDALYVVPLLGCCPCVLPNPYLFFGIMYMCACIPACICRWSSLVASWYQLPLLEFYFCLRVSIFLSPNLLKPLVVADFRLMLLNASYVPPPATITTPNSLLLKPLALPSNRLRSRFRSRRKFERIRSCHHVALLFMNDPSKARITPI